MSSPAGNDVYRSMVLAFRMSELQTLLQFAGKNRAGRKQELQQRAVDLVKENKKEVQVKIKELSTLMYRQMGTASSVNPYSRNYDTTAANRSSGGLTAAAATASSNEDSSGGGADSTNSEEGESESPSSPEPRSRKESEKEREKVGQQIEKEREKEREKILNNALERGLASGRPRRSAAVAACANITANIGDYNRSPDQLDIDRFNSSKSRKSNSTSGATPEKGKDSKISPLATHSSPTKSSSSKNKAKEDSRSKSSSKSKSKKSKSKPKPKSKKKGKNTAYDSDDSYHASTPESSEADISSDEEEEEDEDQPPPITGPATTVAVTLPANKRGSSKTTTAASSLSAETTTTASSSSSSSVPPITQGQLGYRGISVEEQTALVEAEIARRRKAAMELAAKSRLAYQQNYAATTGPNAARGSQNTIPTPPRNAEQRERPSTSSIFGGSRSFGPGPVYPHYPDVNLRKLPFYKVQQTLMRPTALQPHGTGRFQEQKFNFYLSPSQATEIAESCFRDANGRADYKKQIQMRFSLNETSCEQDDNFPSSICVKVNNKLQPLPNPIPTNKPGMEAKRPPKPINITALCKLSSTIANYVDVSWAVEIGRGYTVSIYYVDKMSPKDLMKTLRERGIRQPDYTRALIKEKLDDADNDIMTTSTKVTLACPLGKMRMTHPCRASTCDHLQCFDANLYLMMNEKKPKWLCPVCNKPALFDNLQIDGYFKEVIGSDRLPDDEHEIVLHSDGTWDPLPAVKHDEEEKIKQEKMERREREAERKAAREAKVEVIDDDDDEDADFQKAVDLSKNAAKASADPSADPETAAADTLAAAAAAAEAAAVAEARAAEKRPVECVTLDSSDEDAGEEVTAQPKKNKRRRISSSEEEDAASTSGIKTAAEEDPLNDNSASSSKDKTDSREGSGSDDIICLE